MKFNHVIFFNGRLYKAGEDVPMTPKPEKVAESVLVEVNPKTEKKMIELDGAKVEKAVRKATRKK